MTNQVISVHLRKDEKKLTENLLGDTDCKAMGIAEVAKCTIIPKINGRVVQAKDSSSKQIQEFDWKSIDFIKPGLICLVQDNNNDYFIWAFNLEKEMNVFQQPINLKLEYRRRRRHLITFNIEDEILCLNFVDDDEADDFAMALSKVIKNSKPVCNLQSTPTSDQDIPKNENGMNKSKRNDKKKKKKSKNEKKKGIWGQMFSKKSNDKNKVFSKENLKNEIGEEELNKVKVFLQVARLDLSLLDDPEKGPQFYQFYKDNVAGKHVIEEDRKDDYGQVEVEDEDLYDEVVLSDEENEIDIDEAGEDDFFGEEYAEVEEVLEEVKSGAPTSKVKNMKWPPEPSKDDLDTIKEKTAGSGPPPPAPPPPPPPQLVPATLSAIPTTKVMKSSAQNAPRKEPGNAREDLMSAIKLGGKGTLKKAQPPKVIKDVQSLDNTSMSDLLSGALQKIKNANSLYGDEPNLDSNSDGSSSDWSD